MTMDDFLGRWRRDVAISQQAAKTGSSAELRVLAEWSAGGGRSAGLLAPSPDGTSILAGVDDLTLAWLSLPDLRPKKLECGCRGPDVRGIHWTGPEQAILALGTAREQVVEVSLTEGIVRSFQGLPGVAYRSLLSPDRLWLAVSCLDESLFFFDTDSGLVAGKVRGMACRPGGMAFARDGSLIISSARTGGAVRVQPPSGKIIETFKWSEKVLDCIAVDPGGRQAAIVEDDSRWAHLLNPATGERKFTLKAHKRFINCAALSSNGRWLATGGGDGTVVLWATDTGTATLTSTHHKCIRPDPRGSIVEDVRFDRAGKTLFTSGRDGWVRAFEVPKA